MRYYGHKSIALAELIIMLQSTLIISPLKTLYVPGMTTSKLPSVKPGLGPIFTLAPITSCSMLYNFIHPSQGVVCDKNSVLASR